MASGGPPEDDKNAGGPPEDDKNAQDGHFKCKECELEGKFRTEKELKFIRYHLTTFHGWQNPYKCTCCNEIVNNHKLRYSKKYRANLI